MEKIEITLTEDGDVRFLVNDTTACFLESDSVVRRASNVQPVNMVLRFLFHTLRSWFGEYGKVASFTRLWPCLWCIDLAPTGGPLLPGRWRDRKKAIAYEISFLNQYFI